MQWLSGKYKLVVPMYPLFNTHLSSFILLLILHSNLFYCTKIICTRRVELAGINSFECQLPQHIESAHALVLATVYDGAVVETLSKPIPIVLKQFQVCFFFT